MRAESRNNANAHWYALPAFFFEGLHASPSSIACAGLINYNNTTSTIESKESHTVLFPRLKNLFVASVAQLLGVSVFA
jgi:hypothetical protein